jgi:hypothetical protein
VRFRAILPALPALVVASSLYGHGLEDQCIQAARTVTRWRVEDRARLRAGLPPLPIKLVLGATAQEAERFGEGRWIFLDLRDHGATGLPHFQADFNDEAQMHLVTWALQGQVDTIYPDVSVVKFARWNKTLLGMIASWLAPGGTFFVEAMPSSGVSFPEAAKLPDLSDDSAYLEHFKLYREDLEMGCLPCGFQAPLEVLALPSERRTSLCQRFRQEVQKPRVAQVLAGSFTRVEEVLMVPWFLWPKHKGCCQEGVTYFACSNDAKSAP